jgi:hypothetical protein
MQIRTWDFFWLIRQDVLLQRFSDQKFFPIGPVTPENIFRLGEVAISCPIEHGLICWRPSPMPSTNMAGAGFS